MLTIVLWALATGAVTAGVWVGIVFASRQRRLSDQVRDLLEDRQRLLDDRHVLVERLSAVEDRQDFVERLLAEPRAPPDLRQPSTEPPAGA